MVDWFKRKIKTKGKNNFALKQEVFLFFYKSWQYLYGVCINSKRKIYKFVDSFYFYYILFGLFVFALNKTLTYFNLTISEENLYSFAFATAGIIGASIAIVFSFSTFILQSTADLFSTQYLNKFIEDTKEKLFFWLLVLLTVASLFAPIVLKIYALELLVVILFLAFHLIYSLYKKLRKGINPETTLEKIKKDAIRQLEKRKKDYIKHAQIQNKILEYGKENKQLLLDVQYKINKNWHLLVLEDLKYLFEIGLRLLAKNEINSFNLTLKYIHDIYIKHLDLRNGHIIRIPASFWGSYTFDDEGFTVNVLEYLKSMSDRIIQEKRKENIYYLFQIYESVLRYIINIKYVGNNLDSYEENPIFNLVLAYYIGYIEKILKAKEGDWTWECIKSVSRVTYLIVEKTDDYYLGDQLNQIISKITVSCFSEKQEAFLKELINIYFNKIQIAWNKYEHNDVFWGDLFKKLKEEVLLLSVISDKGLLISDLFIKFRNWQVTVINYIFELNEKEEQKEFLGQFIKHIERWSDFLLDFARDIGLENIHVGLPIIQSVDNNLRIITGLKDKYNNIDLKNIYKTQFNTLSWYFQKTDKVKESFLFNLEQVLEILLKEIRNNLNKKAYDIGDIVYLYIRLIEQHFEKVTIGYSNNQPRIILKLVYLGLLLHKYKNDQVEKVVEKIDELNNKYNENRIGSDVLNLSKVIYDLENDLFSHNSMHFMGINFFLRQDITKDDWNDFIKRLGRGIMPQTV